MPANQSVSQSQISGSGVSFFFFLVPPKLLVGASMQWNEVTIDFGKEAGSTSLEVDLPGYYMPAYSDSKHCTNIVLQSMDLI